MEQNWILRRAREEDLPDMLALVAGARAFMKAQGLNQWQNGYPDEGMLRADIAAGRGWLLCCDGKPAAMAALCFGREPDYDAISNGAWGADGPYAAIHRVAVAAAARGSGIGPRLMAALEALCRGTPPVELAAGEALPAGGPVSSIRVDTHPDNRPMQRLLEKCGYTRRGIITLGPGAGGEAGDTRAAFDKL